MCSSNPGALCTYTPEAPWGLCVGHFSVPGMLSSPCFAWPTLLVKLQITVGEAGCGGEQKRRLDLSHHSLESEGRKFRIILSEMGATEELPQNGDIHAHV